MVERIHHMGLGGLHSGGVMLPQHIERTYRG
jgi:hypothetical protein